MTNSPAISILIVEPNPETAINIQKLLGFESDFKVVGISSTLAAALEAAATLKPDVMVVEVDLPDGDGFELTKQIVKKFALIAVLMMSVKTDTETLRKAMGAGARDFLPKPLNMEDLYAAIRHAYNSYASFRSSYGQIPSPLDYQSKGGAWDLDELEEDEEDITRRHLPSDLTENIPYLPPVPKPVSPITPPSGIGVEDKFSFEETEAISPEPDFSVLPPPPPPAPITRPTKPITPPTTPLEELEESSPDLELPVIPLPAPITKPAEMPDDLPDWLRGGGDGKTGSNSSELPDWLTSAENSEGESDLKQIMSKPTFFSAYYPREAQTDHKNGFYVYAHLEDALSAIQKDVEKFREELGGTIPQPRTAKQSTQLAENTPITIIPESDELQFEPESLTKRWREPFTRFDFDFYPSKKLVEESVVVRVSVQVGGIEIASIKCGIDVVEAKPTPISQPIADDDNPLASARFANQQAEMYRKIFISYSRKDSQVARAYQMAQLAMGNEVFIDVDNLRAGENWQAALARAIDTADIFQMFWSSSYAESEYCRYEWDYALRYRCPDNRCEGFIRPVYWVNPMPAMPPTELGHLNFKYVPFDGK